MLLHWQLPHSVQTPPSAAAVETAAASGDTPEKAGRQSYGASVLEADSLRAWVCGGTEEGCDTAGKGTGAGLPASKEHLTRAARSMPQGRFLGVAVGAGPFNNDVGRLSRRDFTAWIHGLMTSSRKI